MISERGMAHMIDCVIAMKEVLGDKVSLALDCGPGWMLPDAIRFARAVEKYNLMWLEDMLTGDYVPWVNPQAYRELTTSTSTPIHTGEQIYLRHNFKELIETQAVRVIGPDPADIGGIAELKWVAEHAYMHSILMAPHGTANGLLGLGALINVCATLPANYIAFEYPSASDPWWEDLVIGLPSQIVKDSMVDLLEAPGLGLDIDAEAARKYLREEDAGFFDYRHDVVNIHRSRHRRSCASAVLQMCIFPFETSSGSEAAAFGIEIQRNLRARRGICARSGCARNGGYRLKEELRIGVLWGFSKICATGLDSTTRPRYMTRTRSHWLLLLHANVAF